MPATDDESEGGKRVSLAALFVGFFKVSMLALGGGLAWAHRAVVDQRHWMSEEEFADTVSLCQFLPGPNIIGIAVCVGARLRGARGALAAAAGFTLIPGVAGFALGALYLRHAYLPVLQNILGAVSAAAAGLLIGTGMRLLRPHRTRWTAMLFAALAFAGMVIIKLPLLFVLVGLTPLSIAAASLDKPRER
ncbi:MAG TPA: chromate transporter [Stellaceae bacterium]|nr:chromate transporter [Stellaceae bacterium]